MTRTLEVHDIFYMLDGYWSAQVAGESINIMPGDIALLPGGITHTGLYPCRENTRTIFVHFSMEKKDMLAKFPHAADEDGLLVASVTRDNGDILPVMRNLAKTFNSDLPNKRRLGQSLLYVLLSSLAGISSGTVAKKDEAIALLLDLIFNHPHKMFTAEELAKEAGLSVRSLSRRFKAETGKSPHQYQMDDKLNRVASRLRNQAYVGLKNLAADFGFYDEYHLSAAFKKKFGVSPSRY